MPVGLAGDEMKPNNSASKLNQAVQEMCQRLYPRERGPGLTSCNPMSENQTLSDALQPYE